MVFSESVQIADSLEYGFDREKINQSHLRLAETKKPANAGLIWCQGLSRIVEITI